MTKIIGAAVLALMGSACFAQTPDAVAALARKLEGTIYVIPHRESVDGQMTACGLEFSAMKMDFSTKGGAPVKIVGSFYLRNSSNGGLFYALKMGIADRLGANPLVSAPANAFIRAPRGQAPTKARRADGENPGYALFVGAVDGDVVAAYQAIAEHNQLVVGFNRVPGQMDVTATLDLTVIDTKMVDGKVVREKSQQPVEEFLDCSGSLLKTVKK
ncbi:hypothetical protein [Polaromonas eurypsychrophila]|uniref:Uncharacterized protein n=1 Tax=Polaromonas eurypsychrophila TaxID=1614635 RepID=A0A916SM93_9BURK|nr:hypothetical protein [Polaromonas eurypsychrophila]GGB07024.1 hypothetical protein GCM10011496_29890 [Polaromonas eurypsychrophila]